MTPEEVQTMFWESATETPCPFTSPTLTAPQGWTLAAQAQHPTFKFYGGKGARCELRDGHEPPHRVGLLSWYDPKEVVVGHA